MLCTQVGYTKCVISGLQCSMFDIMPYHRVTYEPVFWCVHNSYYELKLIAPNNAHTPKKIILGSIRKSSGFRQNSFYSSILLNDKLLPTLNGKKGLIRYTKNSNQVMKNVHRYMKLLCILTQTLCNIRVKSINQVLPL